MPPPDVPCCPHCGNYRTTKDTKDMLHPNPGCLDTFEGPELCLNLVLSFSKFNWLNG